MYILATNLLLYTVADKGQTSVLVKEAAPPAPKDITVSVKQSQIPRLTHCQS
jgi:hypothetical protein